MKKKILIAFILLSAFILSVYGQQTLHETHKNIVYKKCITAYEKERCRLDLYCPLGVKKFPVLVWFHGGGLEHGDKSSAEVVNVAKYFTGRNMVVAVANYRLSPKVRYPAYIDDAAAAVAWVKKNISDYNGNPDLVFVGGHSAGAYLTAMVGLVGNFLEEYSMSPDDIAGMIPLSGQMNTHFAVKSERGIPKSRNIIDEAAPKYYTKNAIRPCLILVAENDSESTKLQNKEFYILLKESGLHHLEFFEIPRQDHMSTVQTIENPGNKTAERMTSFINKICSHPGKE